jgi:hypothetical protein
VDVSNVLVTHNFETDSIDIRKSNPGVAPTVVSVPRYLMREDVNMDVVRQQMIASGFSPQEARQLMHSPLRVGTMHNDINYGNAMQNQQYRQKTFPRSEQTQDAVMLRRVNARIKIAQDKRNRHYLRVGIYALIATFAPLVVVAILRMWGFAMAWLAS